MKTYTREATVADALELIKKLRWEDRCEVEGLGNRVTDIPFSLLASTDNIAFLAEDETLGGIAGVIPDPNNPGAGIIWMLCTTDITKHPVALVRGAKKWLAEIGPKYTMLWNLADDRNKFHHKLLKMLGFRTLRKLNVGPYFLPYLEIVKTCASQS